MSMDPTATLKNHQNLIFTNFVHNSYTRDSKCDVQESSFNLTLARNVRIFTSPEINLPINPAAMHPYNITYSKSTNTCNVQNNYGLLGGGICGSTSSKVHGNDPKTAAQTPREDQAAVKKLEKENPFLAAILSLTHAKDDHLKNSLLNARSLAPSKLTLGEVKSYNTYDSSKRNFVDLLHFWAKQFYTTTEVSNTLGDCRKDVWAQAMCKWAWKWLGEINFYLNFGEHTGFVFSEPNPYDKDIDAALAMMNDPKNDHTEVAWTYEFEHNLRTIFYYNTAIHKNAEYSNLLNQINTAEETDWNQSVFGKDCWREYFGVELTEEHHKNLALPADAESMMNSECPVWKKDGVKVYHTHLLTYIPVKLAADKDFTYNNMVDQMETNNHENQNKASLTLERGRIKDYVLEEKQHGDYWVLVTKDNLPSTKGKIPALLEVDDSHMTSFRWNQRICSEGPAMFLKDAGYEMVSPVEIFTAVMTHFVKTKRAWYTGSMYQVGNFGDVVANDLTLTSGSFMGWHYLFGVFDHYEDAEEIDNWSCGMTVFDNHRLSPFIGYAGVKRFNYVAPPHEEGDGDEC